MSSASHSLGPAEGIAPVEAVDPVAAVKDNVDRSRQLIAETLDDLTQHHSWLETYHREERRRAERLRRQEALERLEQRRQKVFWTLRRVAVASYGASKSAARFLAVNGRGVYRRTAPRARRLAVATALGLRRFGSWSFAAAHVVSAKSFEVTKTGFLWSVRTSEEAGIAFRRHLSAATAILSRHLADLAAHAARASAPARRRAVILWLRTRRMTGAWLLQARATLKTQTASTVNGIDAWTKIAARRIRVAQLEMRRFGRHFRQRLATIAEAARPHWRRFKRRIAVNAAKARRRAAAFERHLSETVIRTGPRLRHLLQRYAPRERGRALIVRPNTALTCVSSGTSA